MHCDASQEVAGTSEPPFSICPGFPWDLMTPIAVGLLRTSISSFAAIDRLGVGTAAAGERDVRLNFGWQRSCECNALSRNDLCDDHDPEFNSTPADKLRDN